MIFTHLATKADRVIFSSRRPVAQVLQSVAPSVRQYTMNNGSTGRTAWILDFDGTITTRDTVAALAKAGLDFQKERGKDLSEALQDVLDKYNRDYAGFVKNYRPTKEDRKTLQQEIECLQGLRKTEEKSFESVSASGIFKDIKERDWQKIGRDVVQNCEVVLRAGFTEFVKRISNGDLIWGILSVNFSDDFIRAVVSCATDSEISVVSNHIDQDGYVVGPKAEEEGTSRLLTTSDAKLDWMRKIIQSWDNSSGVSKAISRTIYVGDSVTDIECLTAEGVIGIVIANDGNSNLIATLKRIGVTIMHVGEAHVEQDLSRVYWARDFEEILRSSLFARSD